MWSQVSAASSTKHPGLRTVAWESRHPRAYHFGTKGKSCERAVWEQSLAVENHSLMGFTAGLTLLGLTKAYAKVAHDVLANAAVEWGSQFID